MSRYAVKLSVLHAIGSPCECWHHAQCAFSRPSDAADYAAQLVTALSGYSEPEKPHWYLLTNGRLRASFENAARTLRIEVTDTKRGVPG